jgi:hypothetical protein
MFPKKGLTTEEEKVLNYYKVGTTICSLHNRGEKLFVGKRALYELDSFCGCGKKGISWKMNDSLQWLVLVFFYIGIGYFVFRQWTTKRNEIDANEIDANEIYANEIYAKYE